jgi:hypothetical protein
VLAAIIVRFKTGMMVKLRNSRKEKPMTVNRPLKVKFLEE